MNERVSQIVAAWLAHPTGIVQALTVTTIWFSAPFALHVSFTTAIFWYLAYCTFISFATQFTLAYQNRKSEAALELTLRNLTDMMRLLVALAEEIRHGQDEQDEQLIELEERLEEWPPIATAEQP